MTTRAAALGLSSMLAAAACVAAAACARIDHGGLSSDAAVGADGGAGGAVVGPPPGCVNLQCQQLSCRTGTTSVSGTVFAPNGMLPLFNVQVYIPNAPLAPFPDGITCDRCGAVASGQPIATAVTDAQGRFVLTNAPIGKDIPLVMQVGKWRRQITVSNVTACRDNPLTDPELTRLPRNRQEGDLPRIAVTTGNCDQLGCLLPKIGVDAAELGVSGQNTAVTYFAGDMQMGARIFGPPNMQPNTALWRNETDLSRFDLALLSCECGEHVENKGMAAFDAITQYLNRGGRIFGSHYSYVWLHDSTDPGLAGAMSVLPDGPGVGKGPMTIDTSFPKGRALADWMKFVDPMLTYGQIDAAQVFNDITGVSTPAAQSWATSPTGNDFTPDMKLPARPRIVTSNTPVGLPAQQQCGRAAQLDAHIADIPTYIPALPTDHFPDVCPKDLTKGEEALAFLLFDLSACIQDDTKPVMPPIP